MSYEERMSPIDKKISADMVKIEKLIEEENYEDSIKKIDEQINYIDGILDSLPDNKSATGLTAVLRDRRLLKRIIEINKLIAEKHAEFEIRLDDLEGKIKKIEEDSTLR